MCAFVLSIVHDAMVTCGVNNVNFYNNMTPAKMIATDIFKENFESCKDKTFEEFPVAITTATSM